MFPSLTSSVFFKGYFHFLHLFLYSTKHARSASISFQRIMWINLHCRQHHVLRALNFFIKCCENFSLLRRRTKSFSSKNSFKEHIDEWRGKWGGRSKVTIINWKIILRFFLWNTHIDTCDNDEGGEDNDEEVVRKRDWVKIA